MSNIPSCADAPITSRERIVLIPYSDDRTNLEIRALYVYDPVAADICLLLGTPEAFIPTWSHDGDLVVFSQYEWIEGRFIIGRAVYAVEATTGSWYRLDNYGFGVETLDWSDDGNYIVVTQTLSDEIDGRIVYIQSDLSHNSIWMFDPILMSGVFALGFASISPDGSMIAFPNAFLEMYNLRSPVDTWIGLYRTQPPDDPSFISPFAGTYSDDTSVNQFNPSWSPTGEFIIYTEQTDSGFTNWIYDLRTGEQHQIDLGLVGRNNRWLPDGRLAFIAETEDGYGLYVTDASMTGDWTTYTRVPLPFDIVQFDWWIDPATLPPLPQSTAAP